MDWEEMDKWVPMSNPKYAKLLRGSSLGKDE